jgi:glycine dehydrogenase subunit 1
MPFIPHTAEEEASMLATIGVDSIDALFDEIPARLRAGRLQSVREGVSEMEMLRHMASRAAQDDAGLCFLGAGSYDHHIPAAVWDLASRGEFLTAYTPYQAEASQGTLQLIYEYQTMMAGLMAMDVSNASVYDGGSGLGEAILMAVRANRKAPARTVLMPDTVHPLYRQAATHIVANQGIEVLPVPMDGSGRTDLAALDECPPAAVLVIPQPNFFGLLEDVDALTDWARAQGVFTVASVNPLSMALLKPPGEWGGEGVDIACGDGQPFGIPMASGGPSFGFICARMAHVRQMPGRIIGRTQDIEGRPGFTLTLQAREQHIRRGKATSNICTNEGLLVTAATIHLSLLGPQGLKQVALACHENLNALVAVLCAVPGVEQRFSGPCFHEQVLTLPRAADGVLADLLERGVLGGLALGDYYPGMERCLLVCATEKRNVDDIAVYARALEEVLA